MMSLRGSTQDHFYDPITNTVVQGVSGREQEDITACVAASGQQDCKTWLILYHTPDRSFQSI